MLIVLKKLIDQKLYDPQYKKTRRRRRNRKKRGKPVKSPTGYSMRKGEYGKKDIEKEKGPSHTH